MLTHFGLSRFLALYKAAIADHAPLAPLGVSVDQGRAGIVLPRTPNGPDHDASLMSTDVGLCVKHSLPHGHPAEFYYLP